MSNKERKIIGVILSKPSKQYQAGLLKGIYEVAFANDCNVAVFASSHPRGDKLSKYGELSIYSIINYDKLAGIIYIPDIIIFDNKDEVITKPLLKAVREKNIPLVTIDMKYEGIPCFCCDDGEVVKAMVNHMIEVHGCKDIAYMTGVKGHPHAVNRLNAYKEAMKSHGLPIDEDRIFYGDFWYNKGREVADKLLKSPKGLPEAICCACGPMVESVYTAFFERGIHVPRDIRLAGFEEAVGRAPFISTTNRQTASVGKAACQGLFTLINGGSVPEQSYISCETTNNFAMTCGCVAGDDYNLLSLKGDDIDTGKAYFSEYNTLSEDLTSVSNTNDLLWTIDNNTYYLGEFDGVYICMCEGWDDPELSIDESDKTKAFTPRMELKYFRRYGKNHMAERYAGDGRFFDLEEMFPPLTSGEGDPAAYVLRSLHFQDRVFGFLAITYGDKSEAPSDNFDYWINDISTAFEAQRRLNNVRSLYNQVQKDAVTDKMTELYNRNAFNQMLPRIIKNAQKSGLDSVIVLGDLNGLKNVNDTFGHNEGDELIKTAAKAMSEVKINGADAENNFRIGGDEFVKVAVGELNEGMLEQMRSDLNKYLDNYNNTANKPYKVSLPIGFYICRAKDNIDPDKLLSFADKLMYKEKVRMKVTLGINPNER